MKKKKRPFNDSIFLNDIIFALTVNGTLCEDIEDACLMPKGYLQHLIDHPNEVRLTDVALIAAVRHVDVFFNVFGNDPIPFDPEDVDKAHAIEKAFNPKTK